MGGITLPTASTPGYGEFRGHVACDCLIKWLPVLERLLIAKGLIKQSIDILQLTGGYELSGGTHQAGGVFDLKQYDTRIVAVIREMGAPATWLRNMLYADGSPGNTHTHGVLSGCPHNWPAAYQITAQARGYDGMGKGTVSPYIGVWGYGGKDPHPDPSTYRTWTQGIAWAESQLATLEDDLMSVTVKHPITGAATPIEDALWSMWTYILENRDVDNRTALKVWAQTVSRDGKAISVKQELADAKTNTMKLLGAPAPVVDVDETAVAAQVAEILKPLLVTAIKEETVIFTDDEIAALSEAVVGKIGQALAPKAAAA